MSLSFSVAHTLLEHCPVGLEADMIPGRIAAMQVEIKRLNGSIAAARSQLNKAEEHLAACHRFQEFLDSITPSEHFEAARAEQERKRAAIEATWLAECEAVRQAKVAAVKAKEQADLDYVNACTQQVRMDRSIQMCRTILWCY